MKGEQLKALRQILSVKSEVPGKVVAIRDGKTIVATPQGLIASKASAEVGSRVVLVDGEITRITKTERLPQYRV